MEPGRQRAEAWLADLTRAQREADRNAQDPAQEGAGAEIASRDSRGCQPEAIAARACACACPWRPIETAPRDGTWVEACAPTTVPYYVETQGGYGLLPEAVRWGVYHPNSPGRPEWRNQQGLRRPYHTHWRPLPEPPEVSRG